ncbi:unnamed protein product [Amoebophrya sp. A120]|nr:unnamed protein product [Amoebophrya sp. A120]|eukprot:GSA120T00000325001.1
MSQQQHQKFTAPPPGAVISPKKSGMKRTGEEQEKGDLRSTVNSPSKKNSSSTAWPTYGSTIVLPSPAFGEVINTMEYSINPFMQAGHVPKNVRSKFSSELIKLHRTISRHFALDSTKSSTSTSSMQDKVKGTATTASSAKSPKKMKNNANGENDSATLTSSGGFSCGEGGASSITVKAIQPMQTCFPLDLILAGIRGNYFSEGAKAEIVKTLGAHWMSSNKNSGVSSGGSTAISPKMNSNSSPSMASSTTSKLKKARPELEKQVVEAILRLNEKHNYDEQEEKENQEQLQGGLSSSGTNQNATDADTFRKASFSTSTRSTTSCSSRASSTKRDHAAAFLSSSSSPSSDEVMTSALLLEEPPRKRAKTDSLVTKTKNYSTSNIADEDVLENKIENRTSLAVLISDDDARIQKPFIEKKVKSVFDSLISSMADAVYLANLGLYLGKSPVLDNKEVFIVQSPRMLERQLENPFMRAVALQLGWFPLELAKTFEGMADLVSVKVTTSSEKKKNVLLGFDSSRSDKNAYQDVITLAKDVLKIDSFPDEVIIVEAKDKAHGYHQDLAILSLFNGKACVGDQVLTDASLQKLRSEVFDEVFLIPKQEWMAFALNSILVDERNCANLLEKAKRLAIIPPRCPTLQGILEKEGYTTVVQDLAYAHGGGFLRCLTLFAEHSTASGGSSTNEGANHGSEPMTAAEYERLCAKLDSKNCSNNPSIATLCHWNNPMIHTATKQIAESISNGNLSVLDNDPTRVMVTGTKVKPVSGAS